MTEEAVAYDTLAGVYDWVVPEALRRPAGAVDAFASVLDRLPAEAGCWTARPASGNWRSG